MIFHPGIIALLLGSVLITLMLVYSAYEGVGILRNWDLSSGSELQLELERKTYLISTIMAYAMGFQLVSLFLFIFTADTLSSLFTGAMCAAGSLNVNRFGYPALLLKLVNCLLAGLWLIVNYTDNQAYDHPLIRFKYRLLLLISPFLLGEALVQGVYLLLLEPDIITSCCSILFNTDADTLVSDMLILPLRLSQIVFLLSTTITLVLGLGVYLRKRGAILFSIASLLHLFISISALTSFISIYFYALPTHHCPFCILHQEYGYVGYFLYLALLTGAISGLGSGILAPFSSVSSLVDIVPDLQKRLALISVISVLIFVLIAGSGILFSDLSMQAYL